jgi:hypothetical protein
MRQKHIALAISYFSPIADYKFADTLNTYLGSGNDPDSLVQMVWSVHRLLRFHERLAGENSGSGSWYREFMDGTIPLFGMTGLRIQLNNRIDNAVQPAADISAFILRRMEAWEAIQAAVVNERINTAKNLRQLSSDYE